MHVMDKLKEYQSDFEDSDDCEDRTEVKNGDQESSDGLVRENGIDQSGAAFSPCDEPAKSPRSTFMVPPLQSYGPSWTRLLHQNVILSMTTADATSTEFSVADKIHYQVDSDNYPTKPDGEMYVIFVDSDDYGYGRAASSSQSNFWAHKTVWQQANVRAIKALSNKGFKTDTMKLEKKCLGIVECSDSSCGFRMAPRTKGNALDTLDVCSLCFKETKLISCGAITMWFWSDSGKRRVLVHRGTHSHDSPPSTKPMADTLRELEHLVRADPTKTASQLRKGVVSQDPDTLLQNLDVRLVNLDRVAYYRRRVLDEMGYPFNSNKVKNKRKYRK
ncbi:hypothetical protein HDV05_004168 [Chytridiales sp. JEL 0842]|nr:hypothetical protein HDV05_004168 [Chytridiales sp. JEL 0842]